MRPMCREDLVDRHPRMFAENCELCTCLSPPSETVEQTTPVVGSRLMSLHAFDQHSPDAMSEATPDEVAVQASLRPMPRHVGFILDGNRRYAASHSLDRATGHIRGAQTARNVIEWCAELELDCITLWALSVDNLKRSADELEELFTLLEQEALSMLRDPRVAKHQIRVTPFGRLDLLPRSAQNALERLRAQTSSHRGMQINLAVGYGGREEIIDAVQKMLETAIPSSKQATELAKYLYLPNAPPLDLIIRTSGERRLSGFLLWQSAESELHFTDVLWPDFSQRDLLEAITSYRKRTRRFGA